VGSLRLASSPEQLMELKRSVSKARGIGLEAEIVSPDEAARQTWQTQVDVQEMLVGMTEGDLAEQREELALCEAMIAEVEADLAKVGAKGLTAFIDKLTDAEKMYLAEAADENDAVQKSLTPVMRRISDGST
jgi:hypothetical protein